MIRLLLVLALLLVGGLLLAQRIGDADGGPSPGTTDGARDGQRGGARDGRSGRRLEPTTCPRGVDGCRVVTGRIVYVERVDPDGDGDLHVVVADAGISLPGLTSVDVRPGLRPRRDPRVGDRASAAGPVQQGSFGQAQIHALRFRVGR